MSFSIVKSMSGKYWHVILDDNRRNPLEVCHTRLAAQVALETFERIGGTA